MNVLSRLACVLVALHQSRSVSFALATWSRTSPVENTTSSVDTFTSDEATSLVNALATHYALLMHHQGVEDHQSDTGVERPSLTCPNLWTVFYRPTNAGAATLVDVVDVLDFINAPSADDYARFYARHNVYA